MSKFIGFGYFRVAYIVSSYSTLVHFPNPLFRY